MFINKSIKARTSRSTIQPQNDGIFPRVSLRNDQVIEEVFLIKPHISANSVYPGFIKFHSWFLILIYISYMGNSGEKDKRKNCNFTQSSVWMGKRHWSLVVGLRVSCFELLRWIQSWKACKLLIWQKAAYPWPWPSLTLTLLMMLKSPENSPLFSFLCV